MRSMVTVLATAVSISLLACGVAAASITLFEVPLFQLGSVNGQSGVGGVLWKSAAGGAIPSCDPTQPTDIITGGCRQHCRSYWRASWVRQLIVAMLNACGSGEFFYQTYSPQELQEVGEPRPNKVFLAEFAFMSKMPVHQPGLFLSVSPDSGEGSRMSWVGLEDTANGIRVSVNDTPDVDGEFVAHPGPLLDRTSPHRIRFWIKVNQGIDNDLVRISVDGGRPWSVLHDVGELLPHRSGAGTTAESQYARDHLTACSSAPACKGPLPSSVVATCSTT